MFGPGRRRRPGPQTTRPAAGRARVALALLDLGSRRVQHLTLLDLGCRWMRPTPTLPAEADGALNPDPRAPFTSPDSGCERQNAKSAVN